MQQVQDPTPPDPYSPDILKDATSNASVIDLVRDHPIAAFFVAIALIAGTVWLVSRQRRR